MEHMFTGHSGVARAHKKKKGGGGAVTGSWGKENINISFTITVSWNYLQEDLPRSSLGATSAEILPLYAAPS